MNTDHEIGQRVRHEKYGYGVIITSDDLAKSEIMVRFDDIKIPEKYVCFDGILPYKLTKLTK